MHNFCILVSSVLYSFGARHVSKCHSNDQSSKFITTPFTLVLINLFTLKRVLVCTKVSFLYKNNSYHSFRIFIKCKFDTFCLLLVTAWSHFTNFAVSVSQNIVIFVLNFQASVTLAVCTKRGFKTFEFMC